MKTALKANTVTSGTKLGKSSFAKTIIDMVKTMSEEELTNALFAISGQNALTSSLLAYCSTHTLDIFLKTIKQFPWNSSHIARIVQNINLTDVQFLKLIQQTIETKDNSLVHPDIFEAVGKRVLEIKNKSVLHTILEYGQLMPYPALNQLADDKYGELFLEKLSQKTTAEWHFIHSIYVCRQRFSNKIAELMASNSDFGSKLVAISQNISMGEPFKYFSSKNIDRILENPKNSFFLNHVHRIPGATEDILIKSWRHFIKLLWVHARKYVQNFVKHPSCHAKLSIIIFREICKDNDKWFDEDIINYIKEILKKDFLKEIREDIFQTILDAKLVLHIPYDLLANFCDNKEHLDSYIAAEKLTT